MSSEQYKMLAEIRREVVMRRKVWKRVPGKEEMFVDIEQQRQYDTILAIQALLTEMNTREFLAITERIERRESDKKAQAALFE